MIETQGNAGKLKGSSVLRAPQPHGTNQSPPLKPTQPKNTEQPARDRRRLRNGRPIYLNIIDFILEIVAIGKSPGKIQPQDEQRLAESRS